MPRPSPVTDYFAKALRAGFLALLIGTGCGSTARAAGVPGEFDYYALTLSWSPSWCQTQGQGRGKRGLQCSGKRAYAFVLHGLWPQYAKGWPENCETAKKPWVPRDLLDSMLDIMPARGLIIHEYRKHGTCSGLGPEEYYALSRKLFEQIKIPARYLNPRKPVVVSPQEIETDFLKTNHDLKADMISVSCGRGRRLREVRICFSRDHTLVPCGENEDQAKLCSLEKIVMPPVRGK